VDGPRERTKIAQSLPYATIPYHWCMGPACQIHLQPLSSSSVGEICKAAQEAGAAAGEGRGSLGGASRGAPPLGWRRGALSLGRRRGTVTSPPARRSTYPARTSRLLTKTLRKDPDPRNRAANLRSNESNMPDVLRRRVRKLESFVQQLCTVLA
jgi:hypothetical protein